MRKTRFCLLIILSFLLFCSSCEKTPDGNVNRQRITLQEAEQLTGLKPLKEITTDEVWQKLGAQVYSYMNNEQSSGSSYLVKDRKAVKLCEGFGGLGIQSMCVSDLNKDRKPELIFFYHFGSGVNNTIPGCYVDGRLIKAEFSSIYTDGISVKKIDMHTVEIVPGEYKKSEDPDEKGIGKLLLKDGTLQLELYKDAPESIRKSIKLK